jgi:hypothetical protein
MGLPIAIAAAGAYAGSLADKSKSGIDAGYATALENQAGGAIKQGLGDFQSFTNLGPGANEISGGMTASNNLSAMLEQYAKGGFLPGDQDWATANKFASTAYQPQQVAMQQQFQGQQQRAAQLAAQMGRPTNDPIIQAKLSQEYMQGQERLGASQGAFASQFAMQLPQQRLGYTAQLADVKNSLASQAMANRQTLLALGSQVQGQERQFRLQTGTQYQESGGGMKGAITGAIGGLGAGLGAQGMLSQQGLQGAQAQYYNSAANQLPAFAAAANRGPAMAPMAAPAMAAPSLSASAPAYNVPFALQQPSNFNSMPNTGYAFPQFNIFGQMTPGTSAFSSPNGYAPGGIQSFAPGMIPNGGNGLGY